MKQGRGKIYVAFIGVCLIFLLILVRTVQLQVFLYEDYSYRAVELSKKDITKYAERGSIFDSDLNPLAYSVNVYDIWVNVNDIPSPTTDEPNPTEEAMGEILEIIGVSQEQWQEKLNSGNLNFLLQGNIMREKIDQVETIIDEQDVRYLAVYSSYQRMYPMRHLASHLIGALDNDGVGMFGIEHSFNETLKGVHGKYVMETDLFGNPLALSETKRFEPKDGENIVLTINSVISNYLREHLKTAYDEVNPDRLTGIVMHSKTGDILAMETYPDFDLNHPRELDYLDMQNLTDEEHTKELYRNWTNPAVSMLYEPGSVSKIITTAIGLEEGKFDLDDKWNDPVGYIEVDDWRIQCAIYPNFHGWQTTSEALINSCNPAFVQMGFRIGDELMFNYMESLNLVYRSGIGLSGESFPIFKNSSTMARSDLASMSFGHAYAVTPLQMISAVNAVVNDGKLMEPQLIKRFVSQDGTVVRENKPHMIRQVFSESTSETVRNILIDHDEAYRGGFDEYTEGIVMGGKSGTSVVAVAGGYSEEVIGSYAVFAPVEDPEVTILVIADMPSVEGTLSGGRSAGPPAMKTMVDTLRYLGLASGGNVEEASKTTVPDVTGMEVSEAVALLEGQGFTTATSNYFPDIEEVQVVTGQLPRAGGTIIQGGRVILNIGVGSNE